MQLMQESRMSERVDVVFTPREVANRLKVSEATIHRLIRQSLLPAVKIGGQYRVPAAELEERLHPDK